MANAPFSPTIFHLKMGTKNVRIPSELLFELISALPFDIRWAVTRVSKAFDGFMWQKQFSWVRAELIRTKAGRKKKIELLCCVHAVLVYAQNLKNDIVTANELVCEENIEFLLFIRRRLARLYRLGINSPQTIGTSQQVATPLCSSTSVWHGLFVWGNECSFECECEAVSAGLAVSKAGREMSEIGSGDGGGGGRIDLIGLSDSRVVWEYVKQLRDSLDKMVCLLVIKKPEGGQNLDKYTDCFTFCDKENQLGVLDFADHPTIKDGYVFTLSPGQQLPSVPLPLDDVGLPDWTKQYKCIMLMLVRQMDLEDKQWKRQQMGIDTSGTPPTKKPRVSAVSPSISKKIELLCCVHAVLVYAQNLKNDIVTANELVCDRHIGLLLTIRRHLVRLYRLGINSPQTIGTSQLAANVEETVED